jgi:hypothetical protein
MCGVWQCGCRRERGATRLAARMHACGRRGARLSKEERAASRKGALTQADYRLCRRCPDAHKIYDTYDAGTRGVDALDVRMLDVRILQ